MGVIHELAPERMEIEVRRMPVAVERFDLFVGGIATGPSQGLCSVTMILSPGPIDLAPVLGALRLFAELGYAQPPSADGSGRTGELLAEGPVVFVQHVADNADHEDTLRRGLCWLLNQPDTALDEILVRARMPFPSRDIAERRHYLETLWDAAFGTWRVTGLDPDDYQVSGLPG